MLKTSSFVKLVSRSISVQYSPATLGRRLRVATVDQRTHGARVALVLNTGARDDADNCLGLTHCLQAAAVLNGDYNTAFLTTQLMANYGATLDVNVDRENIRYEIACHPNVMNEVVSTLLIPTVLGATYPHWELDEIYEKMRVQKAMLERNPVFTLMEAAHKAAFKGGMSNPLVSPDHMIGKHDTDMLRSRFEQSFQLKNTVLVGSGVSQKALEEYAEEGIQILTKFNDDADETVREAPVFAGKEVHVDDDSAVSHAAIVYNGLPLGDRSNPAMGVLQHILGTKGNVKRGSELERGALNKLVDDYVSDDCAFTTSAAAINYSDCGLFCVHVAADPDGIETATRATAAELAKLASTGFSDELVEGGKNRLLSSIAMSYEGTDKLVRDTATQALALNTKLDKGNLVFDVENVTTEEVNALAQQVIKSGNMALATLGRTSKMPALQELQY